MLLWLVHSGKQFERHLCCEGTTGMALPTAPLLHYLYGQFQVDSFCRGFCGFKPGGGSVSVFSGMSSL